MSSTVSALFAELIEKLEDDPHFDLELFLREHAEHAPSLRARLEKLRRAGFLGTPPNAGNVLHEMRERFGLASVVRTARPGAGEPRAPAELLPSRVVGGRYRILAEIGRGGMGRVFRALDIDLGREVALKVVDLEPVGGVDTPQRRAYIERFLTEAQLTAQLEHPSIVPLHDIGIDRTGQLYYTMKLVEGRTLEELVGAWHADLAAGKAFPIQELVRIVLQICDALSLAHERGVIHRDLKPSNVMIGRFGEVHVMDWGLAKLLGASEPPTSNAGSPRSESQSPTGAGDVLGTPSYMAPEQACGDPLAVDHRADVHGIGGLLRHALNDRAFEHKPLPPYELRAICRKALSQTKEARYPTVRALADDIRAFQEGTPGVAWRDGPARRASKWTRRHPTVATAIASSILVMLGFVIAFQQWRLRQADHERQVVANLHALLQESSSEWMQDELATSALEGALDAAQQLLDSFRKAGFPLDGEEPIQDVVTRIQALKELEPGLHGRMLDWIGELARFMEMRDLPKAWLLGQGKFTRPLKDATRERWLRWNETYSGLVHLSPRLDALLDAVIERPKFRELWSAFRARRRELIPWPEPLLSEENVASMSAGELTWLGGNLVADPGPYKARAAEILRKALALDPNDFWARFLLGTLQGGMTYDAPDLVNLEQAIENLYAAASLNPGHYTTYINLGGALLQTNRDVEALHILSRAALLGPEDPKACGNLGIALHRNGRTEEALASFNRSLELDPTSARVHLSRALAQVGLANMDAAEADMRKAVEIDPRYGKAWRELIGLLRNQGRADEASSVLDEATRIDPESASWAEEIEPAPPK
ncbi:MAG: tetratricopeptide repeat protein [Planctomycetes bacterium]|nr:tetratricopeptide repeat protein [Planctomycetota bacterium]